MGFVTRESRLQDHKNRQNSIVNEDAVLQGYWEERQDEVTKQSLDAYKWAIFNGIAKEQARAVLPEGLTKSRLYMSGTLRSWIHYCDVRCEEGTQKEHRVLAEQAREELLQHFPSLREYWFPELIPNAKDKPWWPFW
jgi:thymidylate synthase (FAD)